MIRPSPMAKRDVGDLKSRLLGQRRRKREEYAVEAISQTVKEESNDE